MNFIETVERACKEVNHTNKDIADIMLSLTEEVGEVAQEIKIARGLRPGPHGKDGVVGEAIDVMLCALDIIYTQYGYLNEDLLAQLAYHKCQKWIKKDALLKETFI